jgi:cellulose biosynthesis protein BcsQ
VRDLGPVSGSSEVAVGLLFERVYDLSRDWSRCIDPFVDPGRPYRVLTIANNKGGDGKTMLAANLAVYLRVLRKDLPILVIGLDDQNTLDRFFELEEGPKPTVLAGIRAGSFAEVLREGKYGIHYVPSCSDISPAKQAVHQLFDLQTMLTETGWRGLVVFDTKSDFEVLTRNAVAASDLTLVVVKDHASLLQAEKVFQLLLDCGRPRQCSQVILSMVDRRIRYVGEGDRDMLSLLVEEIRRRGYPLLESFVSHSPKAAALETNPTGSLLPVLIGAPRSTIHRQLQHAAHDVLKLLDQFGLPTAVEPQVGRLAQLIRERSRED